jgi:hypothetical protein
MCRRHGPDGENTGLTFYIPGLGFMEIGYFMMLVVVEFRALGTGGKDMFAFAFQRRDRVSREWDGGEFFFERLDLIGRSQVDAFCIMEYIKVPCFLR